MALRRLRKALAASKANAANSPLRLTPFVGTGVASAVTGGAACASWRGLLEDGIDRCQQLVRVPAGWADRMQAHLATADAISYMAVADEIKRRLKRRAEGRDFASWLEESVGSLQADKDGWELLRAIRDLGEVIVTTNYDTLLEDEGAQPELHPKWIGLTWNDPGWSSATERPPVVLHLHGMAANPDSVILSSADYEHLSSNDLNKIFSEHLFTSRRFLFIGCGDGFYDPHIVPLMKKAAELRKNPDGDKEQSEGLEHFLLVRGSELRHFIDDPLPDRVSPVAYGADFGELAGFLRKLGDGIDPKVSQAPDDYGPLPAVTPAASEPAAAFAPRRTEDPVTGPPAGLSTPAPPVTTLSLEVAAQQRAGEARAALRWAARAMDQLAECLKLPDDMATWEPADRQAQHELLAVAAADPAADLQARLRQAADALAAAAVEAVKVTLRNEPSVSAPARLATAAADLKDLSAGLADRVALAHDDVTRRARICSTRYRILQEALREARAEAEGARRGAARMLGQLAGLRGEPAAGTGEAGNRAAAGPGPSAPSADPDAAGVAPQPEPASAASARVEYAERGAARREPKALVAAGGGIEQPDVIEDQGQLFPAELLRGEVFVVRVVGESMAPRIRHGDYLIVDPAVRVDDGDIAVLEKEGTARREAIVKKVYFGEDQPRYESVNPDYPGGTLDQDDRAELKGKVVAVSRTIG